MIPETLANRRALPSNKDKDFIQHPFGMTDAATDLFPLTLFVSKESIPMRMVRK